MSQGPKTSRGVGARRCISSKYFLWDPDLAFLSLGVFSAMKEVEWARGAHAAGATALRYSYLGYYIHSNQKMRCAPVWQQERLRCPANCSELAADPAWVQVQSAVPAVGAAVPRHAGVGACHARAHGRAGRRLQSLQPLQCLHRA